MFPKILKFMNLNGLTMTLKEDNVTLPKVNGNMPNPSDECRAMYDAVVAKLKDGYPTVKSWDTLDAQSIGIVDDKLRQSFRFRKTLDLWEDTDEFGDDFDKDEPFVDTEFDRQNDIELSDIAAFVNSMDIDDYLDIYEPDEIEWDDTDYDAQLADDEAEVEAENKRIEDEKAEVFECTDSEEMKASALAEALSRQARLKMRMNMKRNKARIAAKRRLALKRHSTPEVLKKRARKLAIKMLKKRYAKKAPSEMSVAEKERVEKIIKTKGSLISRLTMKMIPTVRKIEQDRFKTKKESLSVVGKVVSEAVLGTKIEKSYKWAIDGNSIVLKDGNKKLGSIFKGMDKSLYTNIKGVGRAHTSLEVAMKYLVDAVNSTMLGRVDGKPVNDIYKDALKLFKVSK